MLEEHENRPVTRATAAALMEQIDASTTLELDIDIESAGWALDLIGRTNMQLTLESGLSTNQTTVMTYTSTQISLI